MAGNGKRLWIETHAHIDLRRDDGVPCEFTLKDVFSILDQAGDDLRFVCSVGTAVVRLSKGDPEAIHQANEELYQFLRPAEGRLFGSCFVRPDALAQAHADLDLYIGKRGFVQVGEVLGEYGTDPINDLYGRMDTPEMVEITRHAAQLGVPLQFHCSTNLVPSGDTARQILNVARQVPEAKIIMAHAIGGRNTYLNALAAQIYLADGGDNIYVEIYDVFEREFVRAACESLGANRLMVGSDWHTCSDPPLSRYGKGKLMLPEANEWRPLHAFVVSRWGNQVWLDEQWTMGRDEVPSVNNVAGLFGLLSQAGLSDDAAAKVAAGTAVKLFGLEGRL